MIPLQDEYRKATMNYDTAAIEIARLELALQDKDRLIKEHESIQKNMISEIHGLESIKAAAHTTIENAMQESQSLKAKCSELERRLAITTQELQASHTMQLQMTSIPGAPFYDTTTQTAMACPVLQSNGQIVPLKSVIARWFSTVTPDDGHLHRTYVCPIMRTPTTLASMATQDRVRSIAQLAGIDTTPPLVFGYKSESGLHIDFQFQDQLNIISRISGLLCMEQDTAQLECIIVQHNTMSLEINATMNQVGHGFCSNGYCLLKEAKPTHRAG